jgi:tetratricopeptide (TPR) repeat protein
MSGKEEKGGKDATPGTEEFQNGLALWDSEKTEEAISEFIKARDLGFKKDTVENNIGAGLEKLGRSDEALTHYNDALRHNPENFYVLKNLGGLYLAEGRAKESIPYFAKALRLKGSDDRVRFDYFQALLRGGNPKRAVRIIRPILKDGLSESALDVLRALKDAQAFSEVLELRDQIPENLMNDPEVQVILGEVYYECGFTGEAVESLKKGMEGRSDPTAKSWLGLALLAEGSDTEGMALLREALGESGSDPDVLRNISFALHGKDMLEEVLGIYERILKIEPDDFVIWNNWGNALYNLGRYKESIPKFVKALEKNPNYEIAWNNIGNALERMGLFKESLPFHQRAIEINEDFDYAHYAAALAMMKSESRREGDKELSFSLSMQPTFPEAWMLKARTMLHDFPGQAIFFASRAVELDPDSAEPLMVLAMCMLANNQNADAEKALRAARALAKAADEQGMLREIDEIIEGGMVAVNRMQAADNLVKDDSLAADREPILDQSPATWYAIGVADLSKGKNAKALVAFRIAHDLDADSPSILSALLRLEEDRERLKKYFDESKRVISKGVSTKELDEAVSKAAKRIH